MNNVIGLISCNYTVDSFDKLLDARPIASLPFGGRYRLIDFVLSSMVNSGIHTVGVITPVNYRSLADHLSMGREWSLNKKQGGMFMLPGASHGLKDLRARYSLRDVIQNLPYLRRSGEDTVLFCAANHVYNIDFRPAIEQHSASGSMVTLLYKRVADAEKFSGHFLEIREDGSVEGFAQGLTGEGNLFLDGMLISRALLLNFIDCYQNLGYVDLMDILEANFDKIQVDAWCYEGYEQSIDSVQDYMHCSMDLLKQEVRERLFRIERPILTKTQDSPPAKYLLGANVKNALVAASCSIGGTVENSILFRNVTVGKGAVVRGSILMQHCVIGEGAVVENVICDKFVKISPEVTLSGTEHKTFVIGKNQEL